MLFISSQRLFPFSRYLYNFCLDFLVMYQNGLIKKIRLISNVMASQPGWQTSVIHILPNISRRKGNQSIKCGHLMECNMRSIFLEKSCTKCGWETSPRPFSEKLKLSISLDQVQSFLQFAFIVWQVEGYCNVPKLSCRPLAFTSTKHFKKIKRKNISLVIFY